MLHAILFLQHTKLASKICNTVSTHQVSSLRNRPVSARGTCRRMTRASFGGGRMASTDAWPHFLCISTSLWALPFRDPHAASRLKEI